MPREGVSRWAAGHTDPHSALGIGALAGILAAKRAMETHGIKGTLKLMGEPAEKVCEGHALMSVHTYWGPRSTRLNLSHACWRGLL